MQRAVLVSARFTQRIRLTNSKEKAKIDLAHYRIHKSGRFWLSRFAEDRFYDE